MNSLPKKFLMLSCVVLTLIFLFSCSSTPIVIEKQFVDPTFLQYAKITGKLSDKDSKDPLVGAQVTLKSLETYVTYEAIADIDGFFTFTNVISGNYTILITYVGYGDEKLPNVFFEENTKYQLNIELKAQEFDFKF